MNPRYATRIVDGHGDVVCPFCSAVLRLKMAADELCVDGCPHVVGYGDTEDLKGHDHRQSGGQMKRSTWNILALLLLAACGHRDPAFDTYVQRFEAVSVQYGNPQHVGSPISFGATDKGQLAYCDGHSITVDPAAWAKLDDVGRERIIFHELGHCVLDKGHAQGPFSIMFAYVHTVYERDRDTDLKELFQ